MSKRTITDLGEIWKPLILGSEVSEVSDILDFKKTWDIYTGSGTTELWPKFEFGWDLRY